MNQFFIELYLDEDVDVLIADLLRARGFKATTTQEAGQLGSGDEDQLAYAVTQQKALFTHNRNDFERVAEEYFAAGKKHHGYYHWSASSALRDCAPTVGYIEQCHSR